MILSEIKSSKTLNVLVWLAIIPSLLGQCFKFMHFPGAAVLLMFGTLIFTFFYLPLFVIESWKTNTSKLLLLLQTFILLLFSLGFLLKIQRWPGANFLYVLNYGLLFIVVTPFALFSLAKSRKININKMHNVLLVTYFFSHCFSALIQTGSNKISIDSVLQQGLNTEKALKTASSRNKQFYTSLSNTKTIENNALFLRITKLKTLADSAFTHVMNLKSYLLITADNISKSHADTLSSLYIEKKTNSDLPTMIMIGNEYQPNEDKYSALKLKRAINSYRDSLLSLVQEENRAIIKEGLNLSTDNYTDENGELVSWELMHFKAMPLLYVFNMLTTIQYEIKNAEYQALIDIINSGNKDLNTALFSQISDLNSKYDAIKKQEEITKLQNENEKGMKLLNAKDSELSNSKQAIVYFALIIIVFLILVFFVIRSNYLRKQVNKVLLQQKEIIESQKFEVESQKHLVEEKQKEIIDSISYAKRLQEAILPSQAFINKYIPNNFIWYKPKDIVAGDFYWAEELNDLFFIAVADSTGHGVPGAMVSVVCCNALNRSLKEFNLTDTGQILDKTRTLVLETFEKSTNEVNDGMDISLLCIDKKNNNIFWSGANNPLWYIQNNELKEIKANKQPIGKTEYPKPFTTHSIDYQENTTFYLFTDGFADQFGGPNGKKFKYKQFSDLLIKHTSLSQNEQVVMIDDVFTAWKGNLEQVDDVCVIGIKI